jgi:surface protein
VEYVKRGGFERQFLRPSFFKCDLAIWDVSKVSTMFAMFYDADSFDQDLSSWNKSRVQDLSYMFEGASSFNNDLAAWDVSKASTMESVFQFATSFNRDLYSWADKLTTNANVVDMFSATSCQTRDYPDLSTSLPHLSVTPVTNLVSNQLCMFSVTTLANS